MIDVGGPTVDGAPPGQVVLGCLRKQAEQVMGSKPLNMTPLWSLLQFLGFPG